MVKTQLMKIQKYATEFREDNLRQSAEEAGEEENCAHAIYFHNLISIENQQQMYVVICTYTKDKVMQRL